MAVFTFIVKKSGDTWTAKQHAGEHNLESSASDTFELQRKLTNLALATAGPNPVSSTFSPVTPTAAIYQVVLGGGGGGAAFASGGAAAPAAGGAAAAAAPAEEEKKVEEKEESDDDMGFSLFD
ncbi:hypothetical protein R1flu_006490 [Riccia fluitans]|uniref:60S acidic ribosomal protein P3 n=1 Tax=Riccia fluitans TaxID=41844 RepID=A0ABD1YW60_9MARC